MDADFALNIDKSASIKEQPNMKKIEKWERSKLS